MKKQWIRINLAVMTLNWLSCTINYYMLSFLIKYLPGNMLMNNTLNNVSEIAGNILGAMLTPKLGPVRAF